MEKTVALACRNKPFLDRNMIPVFGFLSRKIILQNQWVIWFFNIQKAAG
jgi:hypothetical protein